MHHVLLKDVTQESHRWRIRVRVTRFSEYINDAQPGKVLRLDMVFLDEQVYYQRLYFHIQSTIAAACLFY